MIRLEDSQIADILPDHLTHSPEMEALSYAVCQGIKRLLSYCGNIGVYSSINNIPENMLDMLALEINTPYYDEGFEIEKKREMVKNTLQWHEKVGTPAAVEELVKTVFGECSVLEWYQYGGEPYTFRVQVVVGNNGLTEDADREIIRSIQFCKNIRSHCAGICYRLGVSAGTVKTGVVQKVGGSIKVKPYLVKNIRADMAKGSLRAYMKNENIMTIRKEQ